MSGLIGGELGGVLAFRDQMLGPAMTQLDDIATTFISEINAAHAKGMDLTEKAGQSLFTSQPDFSVDYSMAAGDSTVSVAVTQQSGANLRPLTMTYDEQNSRWMVEDVMSGTRTVSSGSPAQIAVNGLSIAVGGNPKAGDVISLAGELRPARTIAMAINDPKALAAGDLFRVSQNVFNTGDATAAIRLTDGVSGGSTIPALDALLVSNNNKDAALSVSTSYSLAKLIVPAGTTD